MPRIFAISDIHIDYEDNFQQMLNLSDIEFQQDCLIIAGDVTDDLEKLEKLFNALQTKFKWVFFVPGNHDLWVRRAEAEHSVDKFHIILKLCGQYGIATAPTCLSKVADSSTNRQGGEAEEVWVVPLFSWYVKHDEGTDTLYLAKEGEDKSLSMWSDNYHAKWPDHLTDSGAVTDYFLGLNEPHISRQYAGTVISFSHFLPRSDLIFGVPRELIATVSKLFDPYPAFNFSSVAGTARLESQLRRLGAHVHIYGHQHRNRHRHIDGVTYISNCLGYPREKLGTANTFLSNSLKLIWSDGLVV